MRSDFPPGAKQGKGVASAFCRAFGCFCGAWVIGFTWGATIAEPRALSKELTYSETAVKAAFLLNFGRFVEWPAPRADRAPLGICMVGEDPFGEILDQVIEGQLVQGRRVELRRIPPAKNTGDCDIAYIGYTEAELAREALSRFNRSPTLTVSDRSDFIEQGGMIQFQKSSDHVTFRINLQAADSAGLKLSSKLLKIAEGVK